MDIIDVMLARAMTPQGKAETYISKAEAAAAKAEAAAAKLENLQTEEDIQAIADEEIKKTDLLTSIRVGNNAYHTASIKLIYPDETFKQHDFFRIYQSTGNNAHNPMSQKAVTDALDTKANSSDLANYVTVNVFNSSLTDKADKTYVDEQIAAIPSTSGEGGSTNLGPENAGNIVIIGPDGNIISGDTTELSIIEALIKAGAYVAKDALGIEVDYENKAVTRTQDAASYSMGHDFDTYTMYGGRMRCNVADDGFINAFYGDENYKDDGSNGQVMVYQPKFYYQRMPIKTEKNRVGKIIRKESILISETAQSGFKLHPIFKDANGEELEYVLLPAYDGSVINNKLASVAGQKPASNITVAQAEQYAQNRGAGWHMTNMAAESANQILEIVEFGSMNGQASLESGIVSISTVSGYNNASQTGSTASLGNATGHADSTENITNGVSNTYNTKGKRAISYRGMENPWGNIWRMIGGINVYGDKNLNGGVPYICTNFSYNITSLTENYEPIGFCLPTAYGWISAMGYGDEKYDWIFMPAECDSSATSTAPVGDNLWTNPDLNGMTLAAIGGSWGFGQASGPFYYACDSFLNETSQTGYGASLMYIPTKNSNYTANYQKWQQKMEG